MLDKCSKLNSEGGNRINRVELPYIPLPEVVAHVFDAKTWYLCPDYEWLIRGTGFNTSIRVHSGGVRVETSIVNLRFHLPSDSEASAVRINQNSRQSRVHPYMG